MKRTTKIISAIYFVSLGLAALTTIAYGADSSTRIDTSAVVSLLSGATFSGVEAAILSGHGGGLVAIQNYNSGSGGVDIQLGIPFGLRQDIVTTTQAISLMIIAGEHSGIGLGIGARVGMKIGPIRMSYGAQSILGTTKSSFDSLVTAGWEFK